MLPMPQLPVRAVRGKAARELNLLVRQLRSWQDACRSGERPASLATLIMEETGYLAMWENEKSPDAAGRVENINEFLDKPGGA